MITRIKSKSLVVFFSSFILATLLLYVYFFIYVKIQILSNDTGSALRSIAVLEEKRKEFEVARSNLEKQKENTAVLESAFFSESGFVDLLNLFEEIGRKAGVKLEAKGAKLPESPGTAEVSFEVSGNFASIARFLVLLDNIRYSGLVNKFSLNKNGESGEFLTAKIDYLIFNYK